MNSEMNGYVKVENYLDLSANELYALANDRKRRDFEEGAIDVYQVTLYFLHKDDCKNSFTANLVVKGDKIINKESLKKYSYLYKAEVIEAELHIWDEEMTDGGTGIMLVDKYLMIMQRGSYQVTITVNKMRSHSVKKS